MHVVLWVLSIIVGMMAMIYFGLLADWFVTSGRMMPSYVSFRYTTLRSEGGMRVLVVYLPGILARPDEQVAPLTCAFVDGLWGKEVDLLTVEYRGELFSWVETVRRVSDETLCVQGDYDEIIFVGASLGGRLLNAVYHQLREEPVVVSKLRGPIIIDSPMDRHGFAQGGNILALILQFMPVGRLLNKLRLTDRMARPPQARNIGNAADFTAVTNDSHVQTYQGYIEWVKRQVMRGLTGHWFSVWRDQLVAIATMPWYDDAFEGRAPLYIVCTEKPIGPNWPVFAEVVLDDVADQDGNRPVPDPINNTVKQLDSFDAWQDRVFIPHVLVVRSTHCGFLERPQAWHAALEGAMRVVSTKV